MGEPSTRVFNVLYVRLPRKARLVRGEAEAGFGVDRSLVSVSEAGVKQLYCQKRQPRSARICWYRRRCAATPRGITGTTPAF
jgi:hypothetical protein